MSGVLDDSTKESARSLIAENNRLSLKISELSREIDETKKKIRANEKRIWVTCDHEWVYDASSGPYDRTRHLCSLCGLWKNPYWYE